MSEKPKIVPKPEVAPEIEETESNTRRFPTKLVRNIVISAVGVAITGYVVSKLRSKDDDKETETEDTTSWVNVFVPMPEDKSASNE